MAKVPSRIVSDHLTS